jgi:hypothetical protein
VGPDEIPADSADRVRRKSLSTAQISDPLGTLAAAYGVEREFDHVVAAIAGRLPADVGGLGFDAQFGVVAGLVFMVLRDGGDLGRIYRGSPLAKPNGPMLMKSLAFRFGSEAADLVVDAACREIRSALQ